MDVSLTGASFARVNRGWLSRSEQAAIVWLVPRLPAGVTPDLLTGVGFFGAVVIFAGYALAGPNPAMLWLASVGFLINWFGDSLDGAIARHRGIARPRFGYFLDNGIDIFEQFMLAVAFGLSGYVRWDLSFLGFASFLMMSSLAFLRASVSGVFAISYGGIGTTELRAIFIVFNALLFFVPPHQFDGWALPLTYPNLLSLTWSCVTLVAFVVNFVSQLRALADEDPARAAAIESGPSPEHGSLAEQR